ncbi:MAG: hypothetical protein ABI969_06920, partial [bacterium]
MLRRLFRLLVVLSVVAVLAVITTWVVTNTDSGRERSRQFVVTLLNGQTHGIVKIDTMHGNMLSQAMLVRVSITDSAGHPFFKADSISLNYVLRSFLKQRLQFTDVIVYHPDVVVTKLPGGEWNYRVLWPSSPPKAPGDTIPGWGSLVTLTNVTIVNGFVTARSPWAPRPGVPAHVRDSIIKDALGAGSRLYITEVPGGYQKVVTLERVSAKVPFVRWADPASKTKYVKVAALRMDAFPFRPPAAKIRALTGNFEFNDDSLWWKGAGAQFPHSAMTGDGVYNLNSGDMRLSLAVTPASFADFDWVYPHFPKDGGGNLLMSVQWKGVTQDYVVRNADLRTGSAHLTGDIGATMTDTVFFHDANVRFTGLTTKQIEAAAPGIHSPRQGALEGRAKFSGTPKRMTFDGDVSFHANGRGTSRVIADGVVGFTPTTPVVVSARDLHVRLEPLQVDIVKILFPLLPIGGTLSGTTTLNGSGAQQLVASHLDIVHVDGRNVSHAVGSASVHTIGRQTLDVDVDTRPIALAELTKFAPKMPFKGMAHGPVHAHGPIDALKVDSRLALPGGGEFGLTGTVDFLSKELGYDIVADATRLDLSWVILFGPVTSLNGGGTARGRGFLPATMTSEMEFAFGPSSIDTIGVDSAFFRAKLALGLANIERANLYGSGTKIDLSGQLGLDSLHAGSLAYSVVVDSLYRFARFIPGQTIRATDTTAVRPRPRIAAEARRRARADSARTARATEIERAIANLPPPLLRVPSDTPRAIPKGLLAGSLNADGTIKGSLDRFSIEGKANGDSLIVQGNSVRRFDATYSWLDVGTKTSAVKANLRADTISAYGFAFDSLASDLSYVAPNGSLALRVRQGSQHDYSLNGDFTFDSTHNVLRLKEIALKFDSTTWKTDSGKTPTVRFGTSGVQVDSLELRSGIGRRIFANGLLPTKGEANFELAVTDFAVENIAELLQSD